MLKGINNERDNMDSPPVITPVIIPINNEEDKCPKCHKPEDIVEVCKHCGYEYPEEKDSPLWVKIGSAILFSVVAIWLIFTLLNWLGTDVYDHKLFEVLKMEWDWLSSIKLW